MYLWLQTPIFDGLVQDCIIPIANALKIQQSSTKLSIGTFIETERGPIGGNLLSNPYDSIRNLLDV